MEKISKILSEESLIETLDQLNEAFFFGNPIPVKDALAAARWLAGRQGLPGSYCGMFAMTEVDKSADFHLFTGEAVTSRAAARHILGEECSRNLLILNAPVENIQQAWQRANHNMLKRLQEQQLRNSELGLYCCGTCSTAYWRNLTAGGLDRREERLTAAMEALKTRRQGDGQWRYFPFYYTLLALLEIDLPTALEEIRYAAPLLEKKTKNSRKHDRYTVRRQSLAEKVLAKV
jgi:hypothetical protein